MPCIRCSSPLEVISFSLITRGGNVYFGGGVVDHTGAAVGRGMLDRVFDVKFEEVKEVEILVVNSHLPDNLYLPFD